MKCETHMTDKELISTLNGLVWSGTIPSIAAARIQELSDELDVIKNQESYQAGYTAGYSDAESEQSETATGQYVSFVSNQNMKLRSEVDDLNRKLKIATEALAYYAVEPQSNVADDSLIARTALTMIKGETHE